MARQVQTSGDSSTSIQAGGAVTIHQGVTYHDARQIALDVFRGNFLQLAGEAAEIATKRAEEITEAFLERLRNQYEHGLSQAKDPDFQYALFTVQREYARCGNKKLGDLLVDLLVDRTKQESRSLLQIVLNESLSIAPKLTSEKLAALSTVFLFRYMVHRGLTNHEAFYAYLDEYARPFAELIERNNACYQHLEYAGCGAVGMASISIEKAILRSYPGLFCRGFDQVQFCAKQLSIPFTDPMITTCLNDGSKKQVKPLNRDVLEEMAVRRSLPPDDVKKLKALQNAHLLCSDEVRRRVIAERPYMERVFDAWKGPIGPFTLTSVGIAIGHANIKKSAGEFADLSIWIH